MGAIYMADRADGEVKQRVAIKLLRPGADDPKQRERFLAERQILATLSYPHIARLLDAGHREDGQP
jgi:serine/threonine protein kinase